MVSLCWAPLSIDGQEVFQVATCPSSPLSCLPHTHAQTDTHSSRAGRRNPNVLISRDKPRQGEHWAAPTHRETIPIRELIKELLKPTYGLSCSPPPSVPPHLQREGLSSLLKQRIQHRQLVFLSSQLRSNFLSLDCTLNLAVSLFFLQHYISISVPYFGFFSPMFCSLTRQTRRRIYFTKLQG